MDFAEVMDMSVRFFPGSRVWPNLIEIKQSGINVSLEKEGNKSCLTQTTFYVPTYMCMEARPRPVVKANTLDEIYGLFCLINLQKRTKTLYTWESIAPDIKRVLEYPGFYVRRFSQPVEYAIGIPGETILLGGYSSEYEAMLLTENIISLSPYKDSSTLEKILGSFPIKINSYYEVCFAENNLP